MKALKVKSPRLVLSPMNADEMYQLIQQELSPELRQAYTEMRQALLLHPKAAAWSTYWKIHLPGTGRIGGLCFMGAPDTSGTVEIGYGINAAYRGQGFAAEAVTAASRWALHQPDVKRVTAQADPGNLASRRVLEKCGFTAAGQGPEGLLFALDSGSVPPSL